MRTELAHYQYRGARALVLLHDKELREFLEVWRRARAANLTLPATSDPDYASLEALLFHVLRAARGYMTWMCESLGLADPGIEAPPPVERVAAEADRYVEHLLERWRLPLAALPEERFHEPEFRSRWGVLYCVDAMLEHAVVHPVRHAFQLRELMEGAPSS